MVHSQIAHTLDSAFHMLKHFEILPLVLKEKLLAEGYSGPDMIANLYEPGSRFATNFAQTIEELLDRLFNASSYSVEEGLNGNLVVRAVFLSKKYGGEVGTCGVVAIDVLDQHLRSKLYRKKNRGVELWHVDVEKLPKTNDFTVILKPTKEKFIFITAFPGPPAMPLPDSRLSQELFESSMAYWNKHVYLVQSG